MRRLRWRTYGTLAILCFVGSCVGCVSVTYTSLTGEQLTYTRILFTQKISGLKVTKDKDGLVRFSFDSQESTEGQAIASLAKTIESLVKVAP